MLLFVVTWVFFLVGCSGLIPLQSGGSNDEWPGYVQMRLDDRKFDIDNPIVLHASYGHDYNENFTEDNRVLKHTISIYTVAGNYTGRIDNPSESIEFFETTYEGEEIGSDAYRCDPGLWLFSKIKYNMTVNVDLDFSEVEYDSGLLVMTFEEVFISQDMVDGVLIETEKTHYVYAILFFIKDETTIEFSRRSFA